jgi:raffinose/stachyose/melibiose transport system permease protein
MNAAARRVETLTREMRRARVARAILTVALTIVAIALLYPILWMILFSFKNNPDIYGGRFFPSRWRWENFSAAFKYAKLGRGFANSAIVTVLTLVFSLSLSLMVSYAVTRLEWKWRKTVYVFFLLGLYIPIHAALLPLMLVMKTVKLLGTYWAVVLPYTAFNMSFCIMVFSGFLETIPKDLEEAAAIDGSAIFRTFVTIIAPLLAPAIAVLTIFVFMSAYNEFLMALVLITKASMKTINLSVSGLFGQYNTNLGVVGAALTMTAVKG